MKAHNFSLDSYCQRIGFDAAPKADLATVTAMMRAQLFSVPFENLDVQAGKIVSLAPEEIVDKIVGRGRGGYCYEVNGLFAMALEALGIAYQFVAARPMFYPARRPRTHAAIVVTLDGEQWLCDCGFGSYGIRAPMSLRALGVEIKQEFDRFILSQPNEREYLVQAFTDGVWANQYGFDLSPQEWVDFVPANYFNSTHPDTIFVQKLLIVQHTMNGRKMLVGDVLKTIANGITETQTIAPERLGEVLLTQFGLRKTAAMIG